MATIKSHTDIEQSKKLAEILPLESADMCINSTNPYMIFTEIRPIEGFDEEHDPCWSLAALMNMLPSEFTEVGKYSTTTYKINIRKYALTEDVDLYQIAYGSYKWHEDGNHTWSDMINTGEKEDLLDAVFQMICWLKENNKL